MSGIKKYVETPRSVNCRAMILCPSVEEETGSLNLVESCPWDINSTRPELASFRANCGQNHVQSHGWKQNYSDFLECSISWCHPETRGQRVPGDVVCNGQPFRTQSKTAGQRKEVEGTGRAMRVKVQWDTLGHK